MCHIDVLQYKQQQQQQKRRPTIAKQTTAVVVDDGDGDKHVPPLHRKRKPSSQRQPLVHDSPAEVAKGGRKRAHMTEHHASSVSDP